MSWDPSYVDPTRRPADALLIKAVGGRSGPLSLENGAKLSFPWAAQQRISGSDPGHIYVFEGSDLVDTYNRESLRAIGPWLNGTDANDRAQLKLDGYFDELYSKATLQAGQGYSTLDLQPRIWVTSNDLGLGGVQGFIGLETIAYAQGGGQQEGVVNIGGFTAIYSKHATSPDFDFGQDPLVVAGRTNIGSPSFANNGNATIIGHKWIQGADYSVSGYTAGSLTLNPAGGALYIGSVATNIAGQWTNFSPTLTQGVGVTYTGYCRYQKIGRTVHLIGNLSITSSGTSGSIIILTLPFTSAHSGTYQAAGVGYVYANSTNTFCVALLRSTTTFSFGVGEYGGEVGGNPVRQFLSGDQVKFQITYEAAS